MAEHKLLSLYAVHLFLHFRVAIVCEAGFISVNMTSFVNECRYHPYNIHIMVENGDTATIGCNRDGSDVRKRRRSIVPVVFNNPVRAANHIAVPML